MRIPKTSVAALTATLMALTVLPTVAQTVLNGDCELGVWNNANGSIYRLTDWEFSWYGGTALNWLIGASDRDSHSGAKCGGVHIKNGGAAAPWRYGMYSQTVSGLAANAPYNVRGWTRANTASNGSMAKLGAKTGGAADYTWSAENYTDTWTEYTVQVTSSATGDVDIQAYLVNGQCGWAWGGSSLPTAMFDDVSIELIPEPGGIIAVLSGVIGLAGFGIRRRR